MNSNSTMNNKEKNTLTLFKFSVVCILFILLGLGFKTYSNYTYNNNMNEFYSAFNKYDFDKALTIINTTRDSNILKKKQLTTDLNSYFTDITNTIIESLGSSKLSDSDAISILSEIKKYDIINSSLDKLLSSLDINYNANNDTNIITPIQDSSVVKIDNLSLGIKSLENNDYPTAMSYFNKVPKNPSNDFDKAANYILTCKKNYKADLLRESEKLIANKYYTDAIAFLSSYNTSILKSDDKDISNKIKSVEMFRDEYNEHIQSYPADDSIYASAAILQSIDINNVNILKIDSKTSYFIYLNLSNQTTYIYEGSINNWKLVKSFLSSTGIAGEETPKGIFSISGRDKWFFAKEFEQGGKYWVRFMGDYLFHSLPFNETQTTIVDETLGTPASHGCVRLKVEDSKWIYDNILDGTKVIIN